MKPCLCVLCTAQLKSSGFLEPLNAQALPLGGLRQDHHGYDAMPVSPANAIPFHALLEPLSALPPGNTSAANSSAGGLISMLVAPDNSSIVRAPCPAACLTRVPLTASPLY